MSVKVKKNDRNFDLMYIELIDVQKNLEESSKNAKRETNKMTKIFTELRHILNIKHASYSKTLDL